MISIIVPNFNSSSTLSDCLGSLVSLNYPKYEFEIIVIDNGSTDNSLEIIKSFPVRLVEELKTRTSYAARNRGIIEAKGSILAFIDADCVADQNWLSNSIKYFSNLNVGGLGGEILSIKPSTAIEEYQIKNNYLSQQRTFNHSYLPYAQTANAFYRKEVFDKIGLFESSWISGGDADLSWRLQLGMSLGLVYAPDVVIYHHHRFTERNLYLQHKKNAYGACLLNAKYQNKFEFIKGPDNLASLFIRRIKNLLLSQLLKLLYICLNKKNIYFSYLDYFGRLGYIDGYRDYFKKIIIERRGIN